MQIFKDFEKEVEAEGGDTDSKHREIPEGSSALILLQSSPADRTYRF